MHPLPLTSGFTSSATDVCSLGIATYTATGGTLPLPLLLPLPPSMVTGCEVSRLVADASSGAGVAGNCLMAVGEVVVVVVAVVVVVMRGAKTVERNASTEFSDTPSLHERRLHAVG